MIGGTKDVVCDARHARKSMEASVEGGSKGGKLKVVDLDTGHWVMLERMDEFNRVLGEWLEETSEEGTARARL